MSYRESAVHGKMSFPIAFYRMGNGPTVLHWHPECELLYIYSGTMKIWLDGQGYDGKCGDIFFVPGGMLHSYEPNDTTCCYDCVVFHLPLLLPKGDACAEIAQQVTVGDIKPINPLKKDSLAYDSAFSLFDNFQDRCFEGLHPNTNNIGYDLSIKGSILHFVGEFALDNSLHDYVGDMERISSHDTAVRELLTYMEKNYKDNLTLENMANFVGVTPNYLCRRFKALTSKTPIQYLSQLRINAAAHMLLTTDLSVLEIALSVGFNDASHFIRTFSQEKGITPRRYRCSAEYSASEMIKAKTGK